MWIRPTPVGFFLRHWFYDRHANVNVLPLPMFIRQLLHRPSSFPNHSRPIMPHNEYLAPNENKSVPNYWDDEFTKYFSDGWSYPVASATNPSRDSESPRLTKPIDWSKVLSKEGEDKAREETDSSVAPGPAILSQQPSLTETSTSQKNVSLLVPVPSDPTLEPSTLTTQSTMSQLESATVAPFQTTTSSEIDTPKPVPAPSLPL